MSETPEFSRPRRLDTLGTVPVALTVEADEAERAALAARFSLIAIASLKGDLSLVRDGDAVTVTGRVTAHVEQSCIATGDPVPAAIDEPLLLRFMPEAEIAASGMDEIELAEPDCDIIGYEGGAIDLGEAVAETMALALDPFPRSAAAADALRRTEGQAGGEGLGPQAPRQQIVGDRSDLVRVRVAVPQAEAQAQEHVHPADRPSVDLADIGADLTPRRSRLQPLMDALDRGRIMAAIAVIIDEFRFIDDPVDFLVRADEVEERLQPDAFGGDAVGRGLHQRRDMIAQLRRHIVHQRAEHRIL
jgi:uncharacterized metal-binding protein YceD (DUF177 family)